jgi:hypothetical protein
MGLNLHGDIVDVAINVQSHLDSLATSDALDPGSGIGLSDTNSWDIVTFRARRRAKGTTTKRRRSIVVNDGTGSAGNTSKRGLQTELAGTTRNKSNLALDLSRVVGGLATKIGNGNELSSNHAAGRVLEE